MKSKLDLELERSRSLSYADDSTYWDGVVELRIGHLSCVTPVSPEHSIARARRTLQSNLKAMHRALNALAERCNSLAPVSCLPAEILARIFHECTYAAPTSRCGAGRSMVEMGWILVTHVCRRWRAVALAAHTLWGHITFRLGSKWTREMLARAHLATLVFDLDSSSWIGKPQALIVAETLERTRSIHIRSSGTTSTLILSALCNRAPVLESLYIGIPAGGRNVPASPLPMHFLGGVAPRLQHLSVVGNMANLPWASAVLRNLISLTISNRATNAPSVDAFLDSLDGMKRLEILRLYECPWEDVDAAQPPSLRIVDLPRLTAVCFTGSAAECALFVRHVRAPTSSSLLLTATINPPADLDALVTDLTKYLRGGPGSHRRAVSSVRCSERAGCALVHLWPAHAGAVEDNFMLEQGVAGSDPQIPAGAVALCLLRAEHGDGPATVHFDVARLLRDGFDPALDSLVFRAQTCQAAEGAVLSRSWTELCSASPGVRFLGVVHAAAAAAALFRGLTSPPPSLGTAGHAAAVPLAGLQVLSVSSMDLRAGRGGNGAALVSFVEARAAAGIPVKKVSITKCGVHWETVNRLKRLVEVVEDGVVDWLHVG